MTKSNSIGEHANSIDAVELFITESLLKDEKTVIPDFGYLEVKSLGNRRTVILSKSIDNNDSFLRIISAAGEKEKRNINALYSLISIPLKEEKIVNLPKIGVFRPVKRNDGEIHVSFILSSYIRKLINENEEKKTAEVKEIKEPKKTTEAFENKSETQETREEKTIASKIQVSASEIKSDVIEPAVKNNDSTLKHSMHLSESQKIAKVGDQILPPDEVREKKRPRNLSGILLFIAILVFLIVIIVPTIHSWYNEKVDEKGEMTVPISESISLPTLAEQHYGNPVFWIYIYEANADKLSSPVNISKNLSLVIPDLKTEYDVDVTDSMEIQRAKILADIVLKKKKMIK